MSRPSIDKGDSFGVRGSSSPLKSKDMLMDSSLCNDVEWRFAA